jgi:hypothetical protein
VSEISLRVVVLVDGEDAPSAAVDADHRLPLGGLERLVEGVASAKLEDPWVLCVPAAHTESGVALAARVLSGAVAAFGLSGAVILGAEADPAPMAALGVPTEVAVGPGDVREALARLRARVSRHAAPVPRAWARVLASSRVDPQVRGTLARRALADDPTYRPRVLTTDQLHMLRALAALLVPQLEIDLAARVDAMLASGEGDGWRPQGALSDADAYSEGLDAIARRWPDTPSGQRDLIARIAAGEVSSTRMTTGLFTAWFEDARNDLARVWLSHPASLARVGYTGFATGGTGSEPAGYRALGLGVREEWEPEELGRLQENAR